MIHIKYDSQHLQKSSIDQLCDYAHTSYNTLDTPLYPQVHHEGYQE